MLFHLDSCFSCVNSSAASSRVPRGGDSFPIFGSSHQGRAPILAVELLLLGQEGGQEVVMQIPTTRMDG